MPRINEGRVTMEVIAEKVGATLELATSTKIVVDELRENQARQQVHIDQWIGPPSIEDRMRAYVDERDSHKEASFSSALMNAQKVLELKSENSELRLHAEIRETHQAVAQGEATRKVQHSENAKRYQDHETRMRKLEIRVFTGMGALAALELYLRFIGK